MEYIAYCGLMCNECPIFIATKNNDNEAKERLAVECSTEHCTFTKDDMNCEGCFSSKNKDSKMCGDCHIRNCAGTKIPDKNCGNCFDYPCDHIQKYSHGDARTRLDQIYTSSGRNLF